MLGVPSNEKLNSIVAPPTAAHDSASPKEKAVSCARRFIKQMVTHVQNGGHNCVPVIIPLNGDKVQNVGNLTVRFAILTKVFYQCDPSMPATRTPRCQIKGRNKMHSP